MALAIGIKVNASNILNANEDVLLALSSHMEAHHLFY